MKTNKASINISLPKLILISISIVVTIYSYGETIKEKVQLRSKQKSEDSTLFTFMRDNYKLEAYAAALGSNIKNGDDEVLANLPFRSLYHALQKKLLNLAVAEAKDALTKNDITEAMQKVMNGLITEAGGGFDRAVVAFREKFQNYPNTSDLITLTAASIHDAKEIFELTHALEEDNENAKTLTRDLLTTIYKDGIDNYKTFTEQNKEALEIISQLAQDGFKMKDFSKCISFLGKELCENDEIKNFSEIMPYVIAVEERKTK